MYSSVHEEVKLVDIGEAKRVCVRCLANLVHYMGESEFVHLWNDILEPADESGRGSWVMYLSILRIMY